MKQLGTSDERFLSHIMSSNEINLHLRGSLCDSHVPLSHPCPSRRDASGSLPAWISGLGISMAALICSCDLGRVVVLSPNEHGSPAASRPSSMILPSLMLIRANRLRINCEFIPPAQLPNSCLPKANNGAHFDDDWFGISRYRPAICRRYGRRFGPKCGLLRKAVPFYREAQKYI